MRKTHMFLGNFKNVLVTKEKKKKKKIIITFFSVD